MASYIRRRKFLATLLGGAAAAWPLAARAQPERVKRIGVLVNLAADDPEARARIAAFRQGLQELGWTDGRNVWIDVRWAAANADRFRTYAAELVALAPDVILTATTPGVAAVQQATRTVPIVFVTLVDPVGAGVVSNLARPGGNTTGFLVYEYGASVKWLELLKQIAPGVTRVAVVRDPSVVSGTGGRASPAARASSAGGASRCVFSELQIDHFVMAITSFEARVRHHHPFMALARCWRLAESVDFVEADTPAAGGGG